MFQANDQVAYVIGLTRRGKEVRVLHPLTFVRYIDSERALVRRSASDSLHPNEEREEWVARLRPL